MISRTSSTPVWEAASISMTSMWRPSAIARHGSHTPHGSIVGPPLPVRADAVQRLGDQPRGRGLADPAHPGQQEGMGDAAALDGVAQRLHHRILADQLGKGLRPIFAGQHAVMQPLRPAFAALREGRARGPAIRRPSVMKLRSGVCALRRARGGSRRPGTKSLWLLPSGSDQVGDSAVRRLPRAIWGKLLPLASPP